MATTLHPIVYWAQTEDNISLKVDLRDTSDPDIDVTAEGLYFKAFGVGAGGLHEYEFQMDFYRNVNPDRSAYRVMDRAVEFNLTKDGPALFWPRLTRDDPKPAWLRIDFDKWKSEDDSDEEDEEAVMKKEQEEQMRQIEKELLETKEQAFADLKTVYLFFFNLLQFIGYAYVVVYLFCRYAFYGKENMKEAFDRAVIPLGICQMFAFLEILHPLIGLVKTGIMAPLMQVVGRNVLLFLVILPNPEVQSDPMVCYLFLVWSSVEVFRYPFYMAGVIDYSSEVLTWLRYTVWIPLYPLGFFSEATVLYLSAPYYEKTQQFSLALPNQYNISMYYPYVIYAYMSTILILAPSLISHMWRQRQRRFRPKKPRTFHVKLN
ncbi:very-long-chain (3R)-3-hydroxyacyl-CoA dehydratase-like isoform X2 [Amphiura filiformis]|uniref:very-long-chain (3R)-3-hydroxyacyl-CoA dehydratase-like isoform X2 n=1 Tax=Amphiura filiformis TaxID=82378 RepID=UPI003B220D77